MLLHGPELCDAVEGPIQARRQHSRLSVTSVRASLWLTDAAAEQVGTSFVLRKSAPTGIASESPARHEVVRGGLLAHRIYVEAGDGFVDGVEVSRNAVFGSVEQILDALGAFAELGVGDISLAIGHDDAAALATLEVLVTEVVPHLG